MDFMRLELYGTDEDALYAVEWPLFSDDSEDVLPTKVASILLEKTRVVCFRWISFYEKTSECHEERLRWSITDWSVHLMDESYFEEKWPNLFFSVSLVTLRLLFRNRILLIPLTSCRSWTFLARNGFFISDSLAVFPVLGASISESQAADKEGKNLIAIVHNAIDTFRLHEPLGRSLLQEQMEPYLFRNCCREPAFWLLLRLASQELEHIHNAQLGIPSMMAFGNGFLLRPGQYDQTQEDALLQKLHLLKNHLELHLNKQAYSETPQRFRQLFAAVCILLARRLFTVSNYFEALQILDEGIMKGIQLDDGNLVRFARVVSEQMPTPLPVTIPAGNFSVPKPLPLSHSVQVLERPSMEQFLIHCVGENAKPLVIKGIVPHFPLFKYFDFKYLNDVFGHRRVPVEFGSSYTGIDFRQEMMTVHEYLAHHFKPGLTTRAYLAQHALLDQFGLLHDVPIPEYASLLPYANDADDPTVNLFIGPAGTLSPLHFDPRANFFCQIRGRKFVRLVAPRFRDRCHINPDPMFANSSLADFEQVDLDLFPQIADVPVEDVVLEEGDCLFLPATYLHLMRSLSSSISLSIWVG